MNDIIESLRRDLAILHRKGIIDEATLHQFYAICPPADGGPDVEVKTDDQSV